MKTAVIVIALFALSLALVASLEMIKAPVATVSQTPSGECASDSDCVPATCCHATKCTLASQKPDCKGFACTMSCETPLDCGAGNCACNQGKCIVKANPNFQ
jgi:hypothetical protein